MALLGIAVTAAICVPFTYFAAFSDFAGNDDEGVLLMMLRQYARGGVLYDQLFSRYGPAYFQWSDALVSALHLPLTHTTARAVTMAMWLIVSAVCAFGTYRLTRNLPVALGTQLLVGNGLLSLRNEPLHPAAALCLLLSLVVVAGSYIDGRHRTPAAAIGAALGAAMLIKINVGLLAAGAAVFALLSGARLAPRWRWLKSSLAGLLVLAAPILMARQLTTWTGTYALVVSTAMTAVALVQLADTALETAALPDLVVLAAAFVVIVLLSCGATILRGTTGSGLIHGILLDAVRAPEQFILRLSLPPSAAVSALCALAACAGFLIARRRWNGRWLAVAVAAAQIVFGMIVGTVGIDAARLSPFTISLPWAWLALATTDHGGKRESAVGKRLVVTIAVLQALHAYPIAGSQRDWATFLLIPVGAISTADGWHLLAAMAQDRLPRRMRAMIPVLLAFVLLAVTAKVVAYDRWQEFRQRYEQRVALDLPGTEYIRVPAVQASTYQWLTRTLSARCASFLTMPGMYSLYLFTGQEPPTFLTATAWMTLLSPAQQLAMRDAFVRMPAPRCVVRNQSLVGFWERWTVTDVQKSPLVQYVGERFVPVESFLGYDVLTEAADPTAARSQ